MPKLSSTQLFILALAGLVILSAVAYLDRTYVPVVVSVVLAVLGVGGAQHSAASGAANVVQGVNLAVPLSPTMPLPLMPAPASVPPLPTPADAAPVAAPAPMGVPVQVGP